MATINSLKKIHFVLLCCISFSVSLPQNIGAGLTPSKCIVKEESSKEEKPCFLPFSFNNRIFSACTNFTDPQGKHWCSTKVDENGVHVGKISAWGHCDMTNPACRGELPKPVDETTQAPKVGTIENDDKKGQWKPSADSGDCGLRYTNDNIVGGEIAKFGEYPFVVLLGYKLQDDKIYYLCGGTLINRFYVLTAAHCQKKSQPIHNVLLGEYVVGSNPDCDSTGRCFPSVQDIEVESVKQHEDWNAVRYQLGNDIALARLKKPASLSFDSVQQYTVTPVCLPWKSDSPGQDLTQLKVNKATITGWGKITNNETESRKNYADFQAATRTLRKAEIPIVDGSLCASINKDFSSVKQICAGGEKGIDSCQGDSGGPLVIRNGNQEGEPWYLIGIVSFGTSNCGVGFPGTYTKVTNYLDWIEKNLLP